MACKTRECTVPGLWDPNDQLVDIFCANYFGSCGYDPVSSDKMINNYPNGISYWTE
jgi:hypothetical protein